MSNHLAFVCAKEEDLDDRASHETSVAMVHCRWCYRFAAAGYMCDCGHEDVDDANALAGHGPGLCVPAEATS